MMLGKIIGTVFPAVSSVLDKVVPDLDADKRRAFEGELALLEAQAKIDAAQLEVNAKEAEHPSVFVAGWRPAIGWICALAIGWHWFGVGDLIEWLTGAPVAVDSLDELWPVIMGMLGMSGLRTFEKSSGIARTKWGANR